MKKPTVLLADDHQIVLDGLRRLLESEFELVGAVSDGQALVEEARRLSPDVVVADVSMPRLNGLDAAQKLREAGVKSRIVFLSMYADVTYAARALRAGALGYVLKTAASDELIEAVRAALLGRRFLSKAVSTASMSDLLNPAKRHVKHELELTPRQREILQLLAEGKSAKAIGEALGISARTVETHKYAMMDLLGVKTSAELVRHAVRHGLVTP